MAVQHTFISIYESAPIINLTLFSIVAVDNHQLAQIIKSYGMPVVGKHILYQEILLSYIYILLPFSSYRLTTYSWWLAILISIVDAIQ